MPNMMELSRMDASKSQANPAGLDDTKGGRQCTPDDGLNPEDPNHPDAYGFVQPFNPCKPAFWSRTCERHPEFGQAPEPFWWSLQ